MLILATGFKVFEKGNMPPFPVSGSDGVDLAEWWDENRFQAYEGVSVPGFPNMFMILGPYGYNGASYFTLIENQARHIVRCLRRARSTGSTAVEVTRRGEPALLRDDARPPRPPGLLPGQLRDREQLLLRRHGDVPFRSATTLEVAWRSARFDLDDYRFTSLAAPVATA